MTLLSAVLAAALTLWASSAQAANLITGRVVDRNNQPLSRAIVSLEPGDVELITDRDGRFTISYLRDASGERIKLNRKTDYKIEIFMMGFHTYTASVDYKKGEKEVGIVTMIEETLNVQDLADIIDPGRYSSSTQSSGASYIGQ